MGCNCGKRSAGNGTQPGVVSPLPPGTRELVEEEVSRRTGLTWKPQRLNPRAESQPGT